MFTQLSGFLLHRYYREAVGCFLFVCGGWFFSVKIPSAFFDGLMGTEKVRKGRSGGSRNYFKMQSSYRPKHISLRIKSVLLSTKIFFICIRCLYSQASLFLPALFLPTVNIFFLKNAKKAQKHRSGAVPVPKKLIQIFQVTFTYFHVVTLVPHNFLSSAFSLGVNWTLKA